LTIFQVGAFGLYLSLFLGFWPIELAASMQPRPVKIPTLQNLKDGAAKTSKPSATLRAARQHVEDHEFAEALND
jgi:hypothetical protein